MTLTLDNFQYLILMGACLVVTAPLEYFFNARVYRRPLRALQALLTVAILFSLWDIIAIQFDLWTYSPDYTTGILLPWSYPLEELVFFLAIPLCAILAYEAVGTVLTVFKKRPESKDIDA